jgi:hypothetical protein
MPPVRFHHLSSSAVSARRLLVRRPWIQWLLIVFVAVLVASSVQARLDAVDTARDSWGTTVTVLVATEYIEVGQPVRLETRDLPIALVPDAAIDPTTGVGDAAVARQRIAAGEIVTDHDVVDHSGPQALTPAGWLAVPVVESPPSGADLGDRVRVASDGLVVSADALVVGRFDNVTMLAVPEAEAPLLPAAAGAGSLTLLLEP